MINFTQSPYHQKLKDHLLSQITPTNINIHSMNIDMSTHNFSNPNLPSRSTVESESPANTLPSKKRQSYNHSFHEFSNKVLRKPNNTGLNKSMDIKPKFHAFEGFKPKNMKSTYCCSSQMISIKENPQPQNEEDAANSGEKTDQNFISL
mgnify:CR=1 FL=1